MIDDQYDVFMWDTKHPGECYLLRSNLCIDSPNTSRRVMFTRRSLENTQATTARRALGPSRKAFHRDMSWDHIYTSSWLISSQATGRTFGKAFGREMLEDSKTTATKIREMADRHHKQHRSRQLY